MLKKELIIGVFCAFILMGSFGTALAENNSLADEIRSEAFHSKVDVAAGDNVHMGQMAIEGTEGSYEAESVTLSTPKALHAAANFDYNRAENWQLRVDDYGSSGTGVFNENRVFCVSC